MKLKDLVGTETVLDPTDPVDANIIQFTKNTDYNLLKKEHDPEIVLQFISSAIMTPTGSNL